MGLTQNSLDYCQSLFFCPLSFQVQRLWLKTDPLKDTESSLSILFLNLGFVSLAITRATFWSISATGSVLLVSGSLGFVCLLQLGDDDDLWIKSRGKKGWKHLLLVNQKVHIVLFVNIWFHQEASESRSESGLKFPCVHYFSVSN